MATRAGHRKEGAVARDERMTAAAPKDGTFSGRRLLKLLIGSGDKIGLFTLPFLLVGLLLNIVYPPAFSVGGQSTALRVVSIVVLIPGLTIWAWSAALILRKVPRGELITSGPYSIVKHPLYTGVALLVLPWIGFLFNTWLGAAIGLILYIGSRIFAPAEEAELSKTFGATWDEYCNSVKYPGYRTGHRPPSGSRALTSQADHPDLRAGVGYAVKHRSARRSAATRAGISATAAQCLARTAAFVEGDRRHGCAETLVHNPSDTLRRGSSGCGAPL